MTGFYRDWAFILGFFFKKFIFNYGFAKNLYNAIRFTHVTSNDMAQQFNYCTAGAIELEIFQGNSLLVSDTFKKSRGDACYFFKLSG